MTRLCPLDDEPCTGMGVEQSYGECRQGCLLQLELKTTTTKPESAPASYTGPVQRKPKEHYAGSAGDTLVDVIRDVTAVGEYRYRVLLVDRNSNRTIILTPDEARQVMLGIATTIC